MRSNHSTRMSRRPLPSGGCIGQVCRFFSTTSTRRGCCRVCAVAAWGTGPRSSSIRNGFFYGARPRVRSRGRFPHLHVHCTGHWTIPRLRPRRGKSPGPGGTSPRLRTSWRRRRRHWTSRRIRWSSLSNTFQRLAVSFKVMKNLKLSLFQTLITKWKENGKRFVDYFKFVIDPDGFGNTVENMFHISFLVQDGMVRFCISTPGAWARGLPNKLHTSLTSTLPRITTTFYIQL